jgi:hypothetical protein
VVKTIKTIPQPIFIGGMEIPFPEKLVVKTNDIVLTTL